MQEMKTHGFIAIFLLLMLIFSKPTCLDLDTCLIICIRVHLYAIHVQLQRARFTTNYELNISLVVALIG